MDRPRKIILSYSDYDDSPRIKQKAYSDDRKFPWGVSKDRASQFSVIPP